MWDFVSDEAVYREYLDTFQSFPAMQHYLTHHEITWVVLEHGRRMTGLAEDLQRTGQWAFIYLDDHLSVLIRRDPETEALIRQEGYQSIRPWAHTPVTPANASQVLEEDDRALQRSPDGATFARAYKAEALRQLGRRREAFEARRHVPDRLLLVP